MSRKYGEDAVNPFGDGDSMDGAFETVFGAPSSLPSDTGRVVARPTPIMQIWPDMTQPRRVVPAAARRGWDGSPGSIPAMLKRWAVLVGRELRDGERLDAARVLTGEDFIDVTINDETPGAVRGYIQLIELALNIAENGLNLPITVARDGDRYLLESGERRYMAHHLLRLYGIDGFDKIAAIQRDGVSVWQQISENTQRQQVNAIGMARSLAKLKMELYADEMEFIPYGEMVTDAGCDRPYFAQVAELQIKRGYGEKVENALNIKGRSMISRYNNLLLMPDELWIRSDEEDWTEFKARTELDKLTGGNQSGQHGVMLPTGNISGKSGQTRPESGGNAGEGNTGGWRSLGDQVRKMGESLRPDPQQGGGYVTPGRAREISAGYEAGDNPNIPSVSPAPPDDARVEPEASGYDEDEYIPAETEAEYVVNDQRVLALMGAIDGLGVESRVAHLMTWFAQLTLAEMYDDNEDSFNEALDDLEAAISGQIDTHMAAFRAAVERAREMRG